MSPLKTAWRAYFGIANLAHDVPPAVRAAADELFDALNRMDTPYEGSPRARLFARIGAELDRAYAKHGRDPWGRHEFYAILLEEVDELWEAIKRDESQERVEEELVQAAAMCFRYFETGDRYRSAAAPSRPHPPCYQSMPRSVFCEVCGGDLLLPESRDEEPLVEELTQKVLAGRLPIEAARAYLESCRTQPPNPR